MEASAAELAAYAAGLKTAKALAEAKHSFSVEYSTMAIVQDALQAFRQAVNTKTD